jgi:hypothetical protein
MEAKTERGQTVKIGSKVQLGTLEVGDVFDLVKGGRFGTWAHVQYSERKIWEQAKKLTVIEE